MEETPTPEPKELGAVIISARLFFQDGKLAFELPEEPLDPASRLLLTVLFQMLASDPKNGIPSAVIQELAVYGLRAMGETFDALEIERPPELRIPPGLILPSRRIHHVITPNLSNLSGEVQQE